MISRRWFYALAKSAAAATVACGVLVLVFASFSAVLKTWWVGTVGGTVAAASGAAVLFGLFVHRVNRLRWRKTVATASALAAAAAVLSGVGTQNPAVTTVGLRAACQLGLGQCLETGVHSMPLIVRDGAVQEHPVVRLILWGANHAQARAAEAEERRASALAQPLLLRSYGVGPGRAGGIWRAPSDPATWMSARHEHAISAADIRALIEQARQVNGWPDTPDTQWWLAGDVTAGEFGIGQPACGDHVRVPGITGVVVRLALRSCSLPVPRMSPSPGRPCSPVASVGNHLRVPETVTVGVDLLIDHEYAEAATDPDGGWQVFVGRVCNGYSVLEIADVCARNGPILSAPVYNTPAGWQPSLLSRPSPGHPAHCVDPAAPEESSRRLAQERR